MSKSMYVGVKGVSRLTKAGYIGVNGVARSFTIDTSDATASAADIESGKTAWVNGVKVTGTGKMGHTITFTCNSNETIGYSSNVTIGPEINNRIGTWSEIAGKSGYMYDQDGNFLSLRVRLPGESTTYPSGTIMVSNDSKKNRAYLRAGQTYTAYTI